MRFDLIVFAALDIHILARPGAAKEFPKSVAADAGRRFALMSDTTRRQLAGNVVYGLPGAAERFSLEDVRDHLREYDDISADRLREHPIDFLSEVSPLAEELGMMLCCHPDDPPFPLWYMSAGAIARLRVHFFRGHPMHDPQSAAHGSRPVSAERARLLRAFDQAPDFIVVVEGPEHIVEHVNDAHRQLFNSKDWIGRTVRQASPDGASSSFSIMSTQC